MARRTFAEILQAADARLVMEQARLRSAGRREPRGRFKVSCPAGFASRIRRARGDRRQRPVAAEIGISGATLCRLENGHQPAATVYAKVARWLTVA